MSWAGSRLSRSGPVALIRIAARDGHWTLTRDGVPQGLFPDLKSAWGAAVRAASQICQAGRECELQVDDSAGPQRFHGGSQL